MPTLPIRGFYIFTQSWYFIGQNEEMLRKRGIAENINFGTYYENGGGELDISANWHKLNDGKQPALRIDIFEDNFRAFLEFQDVFQHLSQLHKRNPTPDQFVELLENCGFKDLTERKRKNNRPARSKTRRLEMED